MVFLNIVCGVTLRKIAGIIGNAFGHIISLGQVNKTLKATAKTVRPSYEEVEAAVPKASNLNIDETGHKDFTRKWKLFTWVFVAINFVFYKIWTREVSVLIKILGDDFRGTIGCDYYKAYISFLANHVYVSVNYCLVHLARDAKNCSEYTNEAVRKFGLELCELIRQMFTTYYYYITIEDRTSQEFRDLNAKLHRIKDQIVKLCQNAPLIGKAKALFDRFFKGAEKSGYFTFIDDLEVSPTNNATLSELFVYPKFLFKYRILEHFLFK
jgi:hypothetical protein